MKQKTWENRRPRIAVPEREDGRTVKPTNYQPKYSALSHGRIKRLEWLLANDDKWAGLPSDSQDVEDDTRAKLVALGEEMVGLGLYAKTTEVKDRTWGIRVLIGEARRRVTGVNQ